MNQPQLAFRLGSGGIARKRPYQCLPNRAAPSGPGSLTCSGGLGQVERLVGTRRSLARNSQRGPWLYRWPTFCPNSRIAEGKRLHSLTPSGLTGLTRPSHVECRCSRGQDGPPPAVVCRTYYLALTT